MCGTVISNALLLYLHLFIQLNEVNMLFVNKQTRTGLD